MSGTCAGIKRGWAPMDEHEAVTSSWESEYANGRYLGERPVAFADDVVTAARAAGLDRGLYIGCGNGRNLERLVNEGLDLLGLDISPTAIAQLRKRLPEHSDRVMVGDISSLPRGQVFPIVVGIQVFQHGPRDVAHAHIRAAQERTAPGGLFCLRVNAVGTDVWPSHEITQTSGDGGFTVRYTAGPKGGVEVHFFSADELTALFAAEFDPVLPLRVHQTLREERALGQWSQWEAIWRRHATDEQDLPT